MVVVSIHKEKLRILSGTNVAPFHIPPRARKFRRNAGLINLIVRDLDGDFSKVFVLAAKDDNFFMTSNTNERA